MNTSTNDYIPVSYLNAYVYCPRRFFLEYVRGMFEDNAHTVDGRSSHHVVDLRAKEGKASRKDDVIHRRSVSFSSETLGIIGKLDLLEEDESGNQYPVEYKKGKKPKDRGPWLNDQVQVCAQALLMQENGLVLPNKGFVYYIASKARAEVPLSEELVLETRRVIAECKVVSQSEVQPPLAENRNKCFSCSLNAICLPEEEEVLKGKKVNARTILPSTLDGDILYVDTIGAYLNISDGNIKITAPGGNVIGEVRIEQLREIVLTGPVQLTTQVMQTCLRNSIPIHYLSLGGMYLGVTSSFLHYHGLLREAQWKAHFDTAVSFELSKIVVISKMVNMRTMMMRYLREENNLDDAVLFENVKGLIKKARSSEKIDSLRGFEGMVAKIYFSEFCRYVKPEQRLLFLFTDRNRRPPRDPTNALLSFGYSLLAKDCTGTALRVGFDPYCGFYHTMKYGRPSLALDMMEFFRQPIVDSVVLSSINNGVFKEKDFLQYQNVCYLNEKGRKKFLVQYQMRKKDMVTHPMFQYRLSYERTIELQFRLLGKYILNETDRYEGFYIR